MKKYILLTIILLTFFVSLKTNAVTICENNGNITKCYTEEEYNKKQEEDKKKQEEKKKPADIEQWFYVAQIIGLIYFIIILAYFIFKKNKNKGEKWHWF